MDRELMQETAALYALAPDEFTSARTARAKELRTKQAELAAQVAKLSKPTAAAAAINRVARDDPSEMRILVQAGRALRSAQEAALSGKASGDVAEATREHRAGLERVQREARKLGLSDPVLERVASTLRAASVDPELQPLLERGLLAREVESAGFGLDPELAAAAPRPAGKERKQKQAAAEKRAELKNARDVLTAAKREAGSAKKERDRVARTLEAAERDLERAEAEVEMAERTLDELKDHP